MKKENTTKRIITKNRSYLVIIKNSGNSAKKVLFGGISMGTKNPTPQNQTNRKIIPEYI